MTLGERIMGFRHSLSENIRERQCLERKLHRAEEQAFVVIGEFYGYDCCTYRILVSKETSEVRIIRIDSSYRCEYTHTEGTWSFDNV